MFSEVRRAAFYPNSIRFALDALRFTQTASSLP